MSGKAAVSPIVFVSGAAEDEELWRELRHEIPHATVANLANSPDLEELCDALLATIRPLANQRSAPCVVVGHSLGGAVAVLAAASSPEPISGVVVVASGASMPVHPSLWRVLEEEGELAVIKRVAAAVSNDEPARNRSATTDIAARTRSMMERAPAGTLTNHLRACDAFDAPSTSLPAVVLAGAHDRLVSPDHASELAERMKAHYRLVAGAGHQLPWERPELIAVTAMRLA